MLQYSAENKGTLANYLNPFFFVKVCSGAVTDVPCLRNS